MMEVFGAVEESVWISSHRGKTLDELMRNANDAASLNFEDALKPVNP